jgi:hyperosmotically inducible protein
MNTTRSFTAIAAVVAVLAVSGCNVFRGQSTAGQYVDDVAITSKVKTELLESKRVDGLEVNVDSKNGRVTLRGWASSAAEAQAAGAIARDVEGVKSVDNQLEIKKQ